MNSALSPSTPFPTVARPAFSPMPPTALSLLVLTAACLWLTGCASVQAPIIRAPSGTAASADVTADRLEAVLKPGGKPMDVDVLLLGEQHDAADHHQIEQQVIATLAARGVLAAVALEMADAGATTAALLPRSSEAQTRLALNWQESNWPWANYQDAVMAAVRAGVPVMGANLPAPLYKTSMTDSKFDAQLPGPALKAQQQLIRLGHCNLLPESQITPMTRVQIAKDMRMAAVVGEAAVPGKIVVLVSGSGHANRQLGVPQHLPKALHAKSVLLLAGDGPDQDKAFDATWGTPALPEVDYCAGLQEQFKGKPAK